MALFLLYLINLGFPPLRYYIVTFLVDTRLIIKVASFLLAVISMIILKSHSQVPVLFSKSMHHILLSTDNPTKFSVQQLLLIP